MASMMYLTTLASHLFFVAIGILGVGFLIGFHELGHFIFCKLFGIRTPSFSIGMGPRILRKKLGDTEFVLSAIPLGGYVEIAGADDNSTATDDSFAQKPYYQKMLVIAGGIIFNIFFAYAAFSLLYYVGMPKSAILYSSSASTTISVVAEESPAARAHLQTGDIIVAIDNQKIHNNPAQLINYLKINPNKQATLTIQRNDIEKNIPVTIGAQEVQGSQQGYLGIDFVIPRYSLSESVAKGIQATHTVFAYVAYTFKTIFTKNAFRQLGGPVMVIAETTKGARQGGAKMFLLLLAFISINLAVLNIIPLPIMDGGQALFYTIEAIIRRPLPEKAKIYIHYICWVTVLLLALFLSIKDILMITGIK